MVTIVGSPPTLPSRPTIHFAAASAFASMKISSSATTTFSTRKFRYRFAIAVSPARKVSLREAWNRAMVSALYRRSAKLAGC